MTTSGLVPFRSFPCTTGEAKTRPGPSANYPPAWAWGKMMNEKCGLFVLTNETLVTRRDGP